MNVRDAFDEVNRCTYAARDVVTTYGELDGYTDPGERAALAHVAGEVHGEPILDVGVGGGRTVALLRALSDDYKAVDYTPALVEACRARHPDIDVRVADARALPFPDASFGLVVFSFNGIDSMNRAGRSQALREMHRVTAPGGLVLFSAHNLDGPVRLGHRFSWPEFRFSANPLRLGARVVRYPWLAAVRAYNRLKNRLLDEVHEDYAMLNSGAHDYGLMIHHIRLDAQLAELRAIGFGEVVCFDSEHGRRVQSGDDTSDAGWFHYVARV